MEHIRDRGNSIKRAQEIQQIVGHLGQMSARPVFSTDPVPDIAGRDVIIERPDAAQLDKTCGWSIKGEFIIPKHCD